MMRRFNDFIRVQKKALAQTGASLIYLPLIFITNVGILLVLNVADNLIGNIGASLAEGILRTIVRLFALSVLFGILRLSVRKAKIRSMSRGAFGEFFTPLLELFLLHYFIGGLILRFVPSKWYYMILFILLNALPEALYLEDLNGIEAIAAAAGFLKDNFYHWIVPGVLLYLLLRFGGPSVGVPIRSSSFILSFIAGNLLFSALMMYRGQLYDLLSGTTLRKREFMNKRDGVI